MRQLLFVVMFLTILAGASWAQDAPQPPEFVPFVVDKQNYDAVRKHLGGLKFDDAAPLVNWLDMQAAKAKAQWVADNTPKPKDAPP